MLELYHYGLSVSAAKVRVARAEKCPFKLLEMDECARARRCRRGQSTRKSSLLSRSAKGRDWPFASVSAVQRYVRSWVNSGSVWRTPEMTLMTHLRHWLCTAAMVLMLVSAPINGLV